MHFLFNILKQIILFDILDMGFLCLTNNTTIYEKIQSALTITGVTGDLFNIWNNWRFELIFMGFAYVVG